MEQIEVNYKNKKRFKTAVYPIRQPLVIVWLIWLLSKIAMIAGYIGTCVYLY